MRDVHGFMNEDPASRVLAIVRQRQQVRYEKRELAERLIAHAAALIQEAFPTAELLVFAVTPDDEGDVESTFDYLTDGEQNEITTTGDLGEDHPAVPAALVALADASVLGAVFSLLHNGFGTHQYIEVDDPTGGIEFSPGS